MKKARHTFFLLGFFILFQSCHPKLTILQDGWTRITTNDSNYKNKSRFTLDLLHALDTNAIYKECCYLENSSITFLGLNTGKRYESYNYPSDNRRMFYRFYSNGYCNSFIADTNSILDTTNFNPNITGFRGVYYTDKKGRICIDLFTQTSGMGEFSNLKEFLTVSGDTLFITTKGNKNSHRVFIKTDMPEELKQITGWSK